MIEKGDQVKIIDKNYSKVVRDREYFVIGITPDNFLQLAEDPFRVAADYYMGQKQVEKVNG
jgi:hypothetical protein